MNQPLSLVEIQSCVQDGQSFDYVFFWGHQSAQDGSITKSCLSQWYPALFVVDGATYPTAEHWMMAEKARIFGDESSRAAILAAPDPKTAKALGRKVAGFEEPVWKEHCRSIVVAGNYHKFTQNPPLNHYLQSTSGKVLVEASPYDRIWGIGMKENDHRASSPLHWQGQNLLGFALMEVRVRLTDRA